MRHWGGAWVAGGLTVRGQDRLITIALSNQLSRSDFRKGDGPQEVARQDGRWKPEERKNDAGKPIGNDAVYLNYSRSVTELPSGITNHV
jgi:hypothetical protein